MMYISFKNGFVLLSGLLAFVLTLTIPDLPDGIPVLAEEGLSMAVWLVGLIFLIIGFNALIFFRRAAAQPITSDGGWIRKLPHSLGRFLLRLIVALTLVFTLAILTDVVIGLLLNIIEAPFFTPLQAALITAVYIIMLAFFVVRYVHDMTDRRMMITAAVMFILAFLSALLTTSSTDWWQVAISALGTESVSGFFFNSAFVLAGLLALSAVRDEMEAVRAHLKHNGQRTIFALIIELLLIAGCMGIVGVGIFPWAGRTEILHNWLAKGSFVSFALAIVLLVFSIRIFSPLFKSLSLLIVGLVVGSVVAYSYEIINWTEMELAMIVLIGIWIGLFIQNTTLLLSDPQMLQPELTS